MVHKLKICRMVNTQSLNEINTQNITLNERFISNGMVQPVSQAFLGRAPRIQKVQNLFSG